MKACPTGFDLKTLRITTSARGNGWTAARGNVYFSTGTTRFPGKTRDMLSQYLTNRVKKDKTPSEIRAAQVADHRICHEYNLKLMQSKKYVANLIMEIYDPECVQLCRANNIDRTSPFPDAHTTTPPTLPAGDTDIIRTPFPCGPPNAARIASSSF